MNQNNGISKLRNVALATILAAGVVGPTYVATAQNTANATSSTSTSASATSNGTSTDTTSDSILSNLLGNTSNTQSTTSSTPSKEETVYVFSKADGTTKNTIVSDWLKNVKGDTRLQDTSTLTDIQNTEGNQQYTSSDSGKTLSWDAQGSDIYYQGNTTKAAPVSMKVTYTLDGQTVTPEEIAGKSGKVTIRFDYTNNSLSVKTVNGSLQTVYTPFVAMTGLMLDNSNFKNITVTNAKMLNDGDRTTVAGYALPGMQTNLGLSKDTIDVPEYFEISADATDFKMDTTMTVVTSDLFKNVDSADINENSVQSSIDTLQSSMTQLVNGSSDLYDGLQQLADGATTLDSGVGTLQDSTSSLPDSASKLASGSKSLASGILSALTGSDSLAEGSSALYNGLTLMKNGSDTTTGLQDALNAVGTDSDTGSTTLKGGLNQLKAGLTGTTATTGSDGLQATVDSQLDSAASGASQLAAGVGNAASGVDTVSSGVSSASGALDTASTELTQASTDAKSAYTTLAQIDTTGMTQAQIEAINTAKQSLMNPTSATTGTGVVYDVGTAQAYVSGANSGLTGTGGVTEGLAAIKGSAATQTRTGSGLLYAQQQLSAMSTSIANGRTSFDSAINQQLVPGIDKINASLTLLANGGTVGNKTSAGLQGAVSALGTKSDSATLIGGAYALSGGTAQLSDGLSEASDGANQLASGTQQLKDATPALVSGIQALKAGTSELSSGAVSAKDGSATLASGLKQFNDEGVQKIVDAYNNNLKGLSDRMKATVDSGKAYNNFSGINDSMDGSVKFIYETDAINE